MEKEEEEIISSKEAAKILHISKPIFVKMLKNGELPIPCVKIGQYVKFRKKDVEDYWNSKFSVLNAPKDKED
jgi:excisionase family DNA binding protein